MDLHEGLCSKCSAAPERASLAKALGNNRLTCICYARERDTAAEVLINCYRCLRQDIEQGRCV